jgi:CRP/FNR family transcriptional regulator, cyclic AMP receptor protein
MIGGRQMGLFDYDALPTPEADLDEITLLEGLSEADWRRILNIVETRHFKEGEVLIHGGATDSSFYILTSGHVDVIVDSNGAETVLAGISEGSVFGEIAFFDGAPRSATIRARTRGTAVRVTRGNFDSLAAWEPEIARQMLFDLGRILAMRLRWTTTRTTR